MKIKEFLEEKLEEATELEKEVIEIILENEEDYLESWVEDVLQYGCVSGMVGSLVYYSDTTKWYENHKTEINEMLYELIQCNGMSVQELFGDNFNDEDPLIIEITNQNLMAWFSFEEITRRLYDEFQEEQ